MKRISVFLLSILLVLGVNGVLNAFPITFSEVPVGTTDPTIAGVSFWAGDPAVFNDTITDDSWTPGNPYLEYGIDDGTGNSPGLYNTFIGVNFAPAGDLFGNISFDILSESFLPGGTTLWVQGLLSGVGVESTSITVADNNYHNLNLTFASGADKLYIYDDLVGGFGDPFHIDNFDPTLYTPYVIPEPATMLLFSSGLIGVGVQYLRRKRRT